MPRSAGTPPTASECLAVYEYHEPRGGRHVSGPAARVHPRPAVRPRPRGPPSPDSRGARPPSTPAADCCVHCPIGSQRERLSRLQEIAARRSIAHAREGATVSDSARRR